MGIDLTPLEIGIFIVYLMAVVAIGFYSGRKGQKSTSNFFLAGRGLPWFVIGFSLHAPRPQSLGLLCKGTDYRNFAMPGQGSTPSVKFREHRRSRSVRPSLPERHGGLPSVFSEAGSSGTKPFVGS